MGYDEETSRTGRSMLQVSNAHTSEAYFFKFLPVPAC